MAQGAVVGGSRAQGNAFRREGQGPEQAFPYRFVKEDYPVLSAQMADGDTTLPAYVRQGLESYLLSTAAGARGSGLPWSRGSNHHRERLRH